MAESTEPITTPPEPTQAPAPAPTPAPTPEPAPEAPTTETPETPETPEGGEVPAPEPSSAQTAMQQALADFWATVEAKDDPLDTISQDFWSGRDVREMTEPPATTQTPDVTAADVNALGVLGPASVAGTLVVDTSQAQSYRATQGRVASLDAFPPDERVDFLSALGRTWLVAPHMTFGQFVEAISVGAHKSLHTMTNEDFVHAATDAVEAGVVTTGH
jgi:hypothetical protein